MTIFDRLQRGAAALFAIAISTGLPVAATADWLVLATGESVETKGPWKVEGRMVIFTNLRGALSSVRASSVDVDSSHALTAKKHEEATRSPVAEPPARREPVLVLTDADFATTPSAAATESAGVPSTAPGAAPTAATGPIVVPPSDELETRSARQLPGSPSLQVMSWSVRPTGEDDISILGYVQNVGNMAAASVTVGVTLFDSEGARLGSSEAALSSTALMPGVQAFLEAKFPGSPNFATVEFTVNTVELEVNQEDDGDDAASELDTAAPAREAVSPALPEAEVREAPAPATKRSP
jgi:hypothetical protein